MSHSPAHPLDLAPDDDTAATLPAQRRCGRCLHMFDSDSSRDARSVREWWICDACHDVLLPDRPRRGRPHE